MAELGRFRRLSDQAGELRTSGSQIPPHRGSFAAAQPRGNGHGERDVPARRLLRTPQAEEITMNHHRRRALGAAALAVSLAVITATQPGAAGTAGYERIIFSSPLPGGGASVSVVSPDGSGWVGVDLA